MANFGDLIGAMLQNTMAPSGQQRMGNALEDLMRSGISSLGGGAQGILAIPLILREKLAHGALPLLQPFGDLADGGNRVL